jgi:uncharacterized membrane protein (UPF0127 family)
MKRFVVLVLGLGAVWLVGCNPSGTTSPTSVAAPASTPETTSPASAATVGAPHYYQDLPQTNLVRVRLQVGPAETDAELCTTVREVATGLMHRKGIGPEETMFFAFGEGQPRSFYMKNVPFEIAAAYINTEGVIQEIITLKAMDETPVSSKNTDIQYVLETAPDWFSRHGVNVGAVVRTTQGSLAASFAGRARIR